MQGQWRYLIVSQLLNHKSMWPMQIFTLEEMTPSEKVIKLIKQIAHTFRVTNHQAYCLN